MYRAKLLAFLVIAGIIISVVGFYWLNMPKYANAIVHGTVQNVYEGCCYAGFGTTSFFNLNVTLDKGTFGNMGVWNDCPCSSKGDCGGVGITTSDPSNITCSNSYPVKLGETWDYLVRVGCSLFKAGDSVDLRVPLYQGGNIWSEPKAVQGYNYYNLSPHTYDYPAVYKQAGDNYVQVEGC